jgi:hypothetical protein
VSTQLHAIHVILKLKLRETLIHPGFYVALTLGAVLALVLVGGFVGGVDSSGFNYESDPLYNLAGRALSGALGATFVSKLFATGPYLFALYVFMAPVVAYLALSSVFRFGHERQVGAIQLLSYGPADGTSYAFASFMRDLVLMLGAVAAAAVFLWLTAVINNLALGSRFFLSLGLVFVLGLAVYAYGTAAASLSNSAASAVGLFLLIMLLFLLLLVGSYTVVSEQVRNASTVASWLLQWISPFYYWQLGVGAAGRAQWGLYAISIASTLVLSAALLTVSHFVLRAKGVRA